MVLCAGNNMCRLVDCHIRNTRRSRHAMST